MVAGASEGTAHCRRDRSGFGKPWKRRWARCPSSHVPICGRTIQRGEWGGRRSRRLL